MAEPKEPRDRVVQGWSALTVEAPKAAQLAKAPVAEFAPVARPEGGRAPPVFRRAPREYLPPPEGEVEIQPPPGAPSAPTISVMVYLIPLVGSLLVGGLAVVVSRGNAAYALLSIPMMLVTSLGTFYQQHEERRKYRRDVRDRDMAYSAYLGDRRQALTVLQEQQRRASLLPNPPLPECQARVERADRRVWERAPSDRDFLDLRLGIGRTPSTVAIKSPSTPEITLRPDPLLVEAQTLGTSFAHADGCAVTLPLAKVGTAGVAGPRPAVLHATRAMLMSMATHHAPSDVKLVVLFSEAERQEWDWLRWLPHTWNDERTRRYLAATPQAAHDVLTEIGGVLKRRQNQRRDEAAPLGEAAYVVVFADPSLLGGADTTRLGPLLQLLLGEGPALHAYGLFLVDRPESVRKEAGAVVELLGASGRMRVIGPPSSEAVFAPDTLDAATADQFARSFAPLRLPHAGGSATLPSVVPLLDLMGVKKIEDLRVLDLWRTSEPSRTLAAPIGVIAGGDALRLDIHERGHGPHGLGAGTTGAGKSELLQTLIASLAVHYHPHELAFVLIDYKGGGMANFFRDLPHQIGIITNLGGNLTKRALATLQAELRRRQRLFDQAGVNNIDDYLRLYRQRQAPEPLPHVAIVADEFAELAQNQPDFLAELMSAVRVGRSLGIHLLLATQKPAGVVNEQITSNTRYRLCLRVVQREDSMEMLRRPDAAEIRHPGRGYFQVGMNEVFELFQAAWGGADYDPTGDDDANQDDVVVIELNGTRRSLSPKRVRPDVPRRSQLEVTVEYLRDTAHHAGIERLPSFWLPPLPEHVSLGDVRDPAAGGWNGSTWRPATEWINPVVGQVDDPAQQHQGPLRLPLGKEGHFALIGSPGSGKTTLLQTLVVSLVLDHSPAEVNLYLVDFGGRLLKVFEPLPHVGAVLLPDESERLERLVRMLLRELEARKQLLADAGIGTLAAYRRRVDASTGGVPAAIVVMLDNYTEFANAYPDLADELARVAREGGNLGIHLVLTGSMPSALPVRLGSNIALAASLELTDSGDYSTVVGRTGGLIPERGVRGRGLIRAVPPLEFQTAVPVQGDSESDRIGELRSLLGAMAEAWTGPTAPPILALPELVPLSDLLTPSPVWTVPAGTSLAVPIGLDAERLEPLLVDLAADPHLLVAGPPVSGKTTLLQTWLLALAERYSPERLKFYLVSMASPLLLPFSRLPHTAAYIEDDERLGEVVEGLRTEMDERRKALDEARRAARGILAEDEFMASYPVIVIVIDDFDQFRMIASDEARESIETLVRRGRGLGFRAVLAGPTTELSATWDPVGKAVKESQTGFLIGTSNHDDLQIFNLRIPAAEAGKSLPPGRGYLARRGRHRMVQIASCHHGSPTLAEWTARIAQKRAT